MNQVKLRSLQYVRRFNFERCERYQTVAEHSHFVALLALEAGSILELKPYDMMVLLHQAILHDAEEAVTGDIPFLVKKALPRLSVTSLEARAVMELGLPIETTSRYAEEIVYFCDILELAMYLTEGESHANGNMYEILCETHGRLTSHRLWSRLGDWALRCLDAGSVEELPTRPVMDGLKH